MLGVGPMSKNCVDATVELSNDYNIPLMLIASRRQIDSKSHGGGYVNNWTTEQFSKYVQNIDKKGITFLARDHGGPWQNTKEVENNLSLRAAMESAKLSFKTDIESDFNIIHIDPSIDIYGTPSVDEILLRIYELLDYCWTIARKNNKDIVFEVGTEEQSGGTNTAEQLDYVLRKVNEFCNSNKLPNPTFVVVQTGTKVMETRNVGTFDVPFRIKNELPAEIQIPKMVEICENNNILLKQHNTDYLSDEALSWHPKFGIHSANVAPEFGVAETRALLSLFDEYNLNDYKEQFLRISYESKKWDKWMIDKSQPDYIKAVISGHYVFSHPNVVELKKEAQLKINNLNIDDFLKQEVKRSIFRYIKNYKLC
jgi:hypothetical protein